MNNKFNLIQEIQRIENLNNSFLDVNKNFNFIDKQEVEAYLNFLKNYSSLTKFLPNIKANNDCLTKNILIYLLIRNSANEQSQDILQSKIITFDYLKNLEFNYQSGILEVYLLTGLYFIHKNLDHPVINLKKSLIKYFHDMGGFEIDLWGVNFKLDVLKEIIFNSDINNLKKILTKSNKVDWSHLYMLNYK